MKFVYNPDYVYAPNGSGLGDILTSLCFASHIAEASSRPISVSDWYYKRDRVTVKDCHAKITECLDLMNDAAASRIVITTDEPDETFKWQHCYGWKYPKSKIVWDSAPQQTKYVCYQFDGKSHCEKNFSKEEEELVLGNIRSFGYDTVRLGGHLKLKECLMLLRNATAFVGIDSGFTHLSMMSGLPIFISRNGRSVVDMRHTYNDNDYVMAEDSRDLVNMLIVFLRRLSPDFDFYDYHSKKGTYEQKNPLSC